MSVSWRNRSTVLGYNFTPTSISSSMDILSVNHGVIYSAVLLFYYRFYHFANKDFHNKQDAQEDKFGKHRTLIINVSVVDSPSVSDKHCATNCLSTLISVSH